MIQIEELHKSYRMGSNNLHVLKGINLDIKEGDKASNTFLSMVNETFEGDVQKTRRQLLEYCELDTYAMVKILEKLLQV